MSGLTASEAAERLGVPKTTLHTWLAKLPVPQETDSRGRKRLDADALAVLEAVKAMRLDDCGYQTIRRKLEGVNESDPFTAERERSTTAGDPFANGSDPTAPDSLDMAAIVEAVSTAIAGQTDLAEKYARAAHTIGQLEERTRGLEGERDRLVGELAAARALLAAPKPAPWWKVW